VSGSVPFDAGRLILRDPGPDLESVLGRLARVLVSAPGLPEGLTPERLDERIRERLQDRLTWLGHGVVAVHLRPAGVAGVRLALATLETTLRAEEQDVRWVCLVLAPRERPIQEVRLLDQLRSLVEDPACRSYIDRATEPASLAPWLDARLRQVDGPLTARDLMRPSLDRVGPEIPVTELVHRMAQLGLDCAGITDENRRLMGQVSASDIFTYGVPDFFRQLKSVAFIPEFDPFERYFASESTLLAKDVMSTELAALPPDATVLEVVFALSVQGHPKVFVVEDDRLIGVIDSIRVVDRILSS
jgi:CBS-domain-containing membrane protein